MKLTDYEIVNRINIGDESIYQYLYDNYYQAMFLVAKHIVRDDYIAESIISDLFIRIWERRESFCVEYSLKSYLISSTRNLSINYLKQKFIRDKVCFDDLELTSPLLLMSDDTPVGRLVEEESAQKLLSLIESLPAETKEVFQLSRLDGLKYNEIATKLNISNNTVKYHIKRALHLLRQVMLMIIMLPS